MWRFAMALLLQLSLSTQALACRSTDYNVEGMLKFESAIQECRDNVVTRCWSSVKVLWCKDANKTAGTDGSIMLVPTPTPYLAVSEDNVTGVLVPCPTAVGDVRGSRAEGFIVDDEGNKVTFALYSGSASGLMIMTSHSDKCLYDFKLVSATSDILNTQPQRYGRNSAQRAAGGLLAVMAALIGLAALL